MHLIVIRHGETIMNIDERLQGSLGPNEPLTENGVVQAKALRDGLMISPETIYVSPLLRAQQTAHIINERFHAPMQTREELLERNFGSLSGLYKKDIDPRILEIDLESRYDYHEYGGESVADVKKRVLMFLSSLPLESSETNFVVTHRGVIRVLYDLYPKNVRPEEVLPGTTHPFDISALP